MPPQPPPPAAPAPSEFGDRGGEGPETRPNPPLRGAELVWAVALLLVTGIGGVWFFHGTAPTMLDTVVPTFLTSDHHSFLTDVTSLRYPQVMVVASAVLAVVAFPRDRVRSLVCLVGPPTALVTTELLVKPLVGRTLGPGLSYPSGSTVGAAALGVAAVLAVPAAWRRATVVVATVYGLWMALAVISLQWHYPTDAAAGLAYGCGFVLLVDVAARSVAVPLCRLGIGRRALDS